MSSAPPRRCRPICVKPPPASAWPAGRCGGGCCCRPFPAYVTGGLTASGGAWNASVVAEVVSWGNTTLTATGIGAYIAAQTAAGDHPRIALGVAVMSLYVGLLNRTVWERLYTFARERFSF